MTDRIKDLFDAYAAGRVSRRDLMRGAARLGITAASANFLLGSSAIEAMAADYDWQAQKGTAIKLLLDKHPYADAMIADIENFKKLTGIEVTYDVFPEDVYFDKVTAALSSKSDQYDAFMTGAYMTWNAAGLRSRTHAGRLGGRPQRVHQGSEADQSELRVG